jgi:hypothetical protein
MIADASQLDIKLITVLPALIRRVRNERGRYYASLALNSMSEQ